MVENNRIFSNIFQAKSAIVNSMVSHCYRDELLETITLYDMIRVLLKRIIAIAVKKKFKDIFIINNLK